MLKGERQVAPTLAGIRVDHVARYNWAAATLPPGSRVLDLACGVGYGAYILAQAGHTVTAVDRDREAIDYANAHWRHARIKFMCCEAANDAYMATRFDAVTCFETIEHIKDPLPVLQRFARAIPLLLASVPNEEKFPWENYAFHHRHYTKSEFADLLGQAGFAASGWLGQTGAKSEVAKNINGRTLIVVAKRANAVKTKKQTVPPKPRAKKVAVNIAPTQRPVPKSVAILGLGPSLHTYLNVVKRLGGRHKLCDETWGVNAVIDLIRCDVGFHMDNICVQEIRAAAAPKSNIAAMLPWLKTHPGPIFTSVPHPDYPGMTEYPLAAVLNACGGNRYFNGTVAYAVAYAIFIGVKKIYFFGADYTYGNSTHAEKGRGCLEHWIGFAMARGIEISVAGTSTLLDACVPARERLYGYDGVAVDISGPIGNETVKFSPRDLPSAEEIEHRYDHSQPTTPQHLRGEDAAA